MKGTNNMKLSLTLYSSLKQYCPPEFSGGKGTIDLKEGSTVSDLIEFLGISPLEEYTVVLNNRLAKEEDVLADGDQVAFLPPVSGG